MKKYLFILAAAAAALLASCQPSELDIVVSDNDADANLVTISITATLDEATKATVDDGSKTWVWSADDHLAVFDGIAKRDFVLTDGAGTTTATFEGTIDGGAASIDAIFPYAAAAGDTYEAGYSIPAAQTVTAENVADPAAMVATATGNKVGSAWNLTFTSAVSFMRFTSGAAGRFIFHAVDKEDKMTGDGRAVAVVVPAAGTWWVAVKPAEYSGLRVFRRITDHDYMVSSASTLDLSTAGAARNVGTINSVAHEVVAIETADELIAYLGGSPTLDAYICADLDLTAKSVTTCATYARNFDGQYHKINNWTSSGVALFGTVTGSVNNIVIDSSCSITPSSGDFGIIAKVLDSSGRISGCTNHANISISIGDASDSHVFGTIVGRLKSAASSLYDSSNTGNVSATFDITSRPEEGGAMSTQYVAGLVGVFAGPGTEVRISGCTNSGSISISGTGGQVYANLRNVYIGGIAASTGVNKGKKDENETAFTRYYGKVVGCTNSGPISAAWDGGTGGYFRVGGVVGYGECSFENCHNNAKVSYINSNSAQNAGPAIGGISSIVAGTCALSATDCTNSGQIKLEGMFSNASTTYGSACAGNNSAVAGGCFGLVGDNTSAISNCENTGKLLFNIIMKDAGGLQCALGGVVGKSFASMDNCDNHCLNEIELSSKSATAYIGGVVGLINNQITNSENTAAVLCNRDNAGAAQTTYFGGVVGYYDSASEVNNCDNAGNLTINVGSSSAKSYFSGIIGWNNAGTSIKNCDNSGDIGFDGGEMVKQVYIGGVTASTVPAATIIDSCTNSGDITASNWSNGSFNYLGGILGTYENTGVTIKNCTNTGGITSTAKSKMRLGGIAAALNGTMTNCVSENCTLSMSAGKALSTVGGLLGYCGANVTGGSANCTITCSGNGATSRAGLLFGDVAKNKTAKSITANGSITTDANTSAGFVTGGFQEASAKYTLGADGLPVKISSSATINGAHVSNPPEAVELLADNTTFAGTLTVTNVVVE